MQVTTWPMAASFHHCGWCTSTQKSTFDTHSSDGNQLYVLFKPNNRADRPSTQIVLNESNGAWSLLKKGNCKYLKDDWLLLPPRIKSWIQARKDACKAEKQKRQARTIRIDLAGCEFNFDEFRQAIERAVGRRHRYESVPVDWGVAAYSCQRPTRQAFKKDTRDIELVAPISSADVVVDYQREKDFGDVYKSRDPPLH